VHDKNILIKDENQDLFALYKVFLDSLLENNRQKAIDLIMDAVENGVSIKDIYLKVFQPTQHQIGTLWQTNEITVAQEHYCTAVTQMIMSMLYPKIFNSDKNNYRLLATCIKGELHEIGIRMVADFFEMEGWDTYYLGASTPDESIIHTIASIQPHIVAISASMTYNIYPVAELINKIKNTGRLNQIKIMVGGRPFNIEPHLWKSVKADIYAADANEAVQIALDKIKS